MGLTRNGDYVRSIEKTPAVIGSNDDEFPVAHKSNGSDEFDLLDLVP